MPSGKIEEYRRGRRGPSCHPSPEVEQYKIAISNALLAKKNIKPSRLPLLLAMGNGSNSCKYRIYTRVVDDSLPSRRIGSVRTEALLYGGLTHKSEKEQDVYYRRILDDSTGPNGFVF